MVDRALLEARALASVARAGMLRPAGPGALLGSARALHDYGPLGAGLVSAALLHGDRDAVVDDAGRWTFRELDERANAVANALRSRGWGNGAGVGILARNHAGALAAIFGAAKAGSRAVYLNTSFAAPQVRDVAAREGVGAILVDEDLDELLGEVDPAVERVRCFAEGRPPLEELVGGASTEAPPAPDRKAKVVLLTSGTTGTPKGAPRDMPRSLLVPGAILDRIPFRSREGVVIAAPLFHATGFALAALTLALGSTMVLRRRFDPERVLADLASERATGLVVVPVMLQRLLALGEERLRAEPLDALRVVFCAGSQLSGDLAGRAMDVLGDVVYNLYGSTEVSYATIATPADLRAAPGTAGRPALGARVRILDAEGREVPRGETGRIFVGNASRFEGYTGGGSKEEIDGLLSTGDVGHFDAEGRLFVDGRDDEMIVSGGENVFPREVEELLVAHPDVDDAAAVGVPDREFGQRLAAFVVRTPGSRIDADSVRDHVKENLARFKVPRDVEFVEELPRNPAGKILKRELLREVGSP